MDVSRFDAHSPGDLAPIVGHDTYLDRPYKHFAFVPRPLEEFPTLEPSTFGILAKADAAVARLDGLTTRLPDPMILVRPTLLREAISTSALEGTYAAARNVLAADLTPEESRSQAEREILNVARATYLAIRLIQQKPICMTVLNELQQAIVAGTRSDGPQAGRLRTSQVYIGKQRDGIEKSRFVPAPPGETLIAGYDLWEKWINSGVELPITLGVALGHYQFETLHPYHDGNGRLGRLVMMLQFLESGALKYPVLNLSPWLDDRKDEYRDGLLNVSVTGDFDTWVRFIAQCVIEQSAEAADQIGKLVDYRDDLLRRLHAAKARGVILRLAADIVGRPIMSPSQVAKEYGVTYPPASKAIAQLVKMGVLVEITGQQYGRLYECEAVYRILGFDN